MSKSASEEVLLQIPYVRNKKTEGTLFMMGERMAWMQGHKETFTLSYRYSDIKVQKISPESKEKVQLQIVMHDSSANTFHFVNPGGHDFQLRDRDAVKELLMQLMPKFHRIISSELEEKNRMLQEDPELLQKYKDLVVGGILSADEFWANRFGKKGGKTADKQNVGVSSAPLAEIKPQTDGCNGIRFNLTMDTMQAIFKIYPSVKKKHMECVPHKLSEQEFWTQFFQSHYFHLDHLYSGQSGLFADIAKHEENGVQTRSEMRADKLLYYMTIADKTISEGDLALSLDGEENYSSSSKTSLIHRLNQRSAMVLRSCERYNLEVLISDDKNSAVSTTTKSSKASEISDFTDTNSMDIDYDMAKKKKIIEKTRLDDLEDDSDLEEVRGAPKLQLNEVSHYMHGPVPLTAMHYITSDEIQHACQCTLEDSISWRPQFSQVLVPSIASSVFSELCPGGLLMQQHNSGSMQHILPSETQQELRNAYGAVSELLRHFWSCFPVNNKALEEKVVRVYESLQRFRKAKLAQLQQEKTSGLRPGHLVVHIEEMLTAAEAKYNTWQSKHAVVSSRS